MLVDRHPDVVETFDIRSDDGLRSETPHEFARVEDCHTGAAALADVMADWVTNGTSA